MVERHYIFPKAVTAELLKLEKLHSTAQIKETCSHFHRFIALRQ